MTVSAQTPINRSTGNGVTTVFPYTFKIISDADIEVTVDDVVKTLNVDYTVTGAGVDAGGNVTMTTAPAVATTVVRRRNMAIVRTTDYQDQGALPAATLDADIDSAVLMIQQLDERLDRTFSLPASSSADSAMPTPTAGYVIGWDALGESLTNLPATVGTSLIDLAASSGSSLVGFIQSGVGALATTVQTKLRQIVYIEDFGASPTASALDNSTAIEAAMTYAASILGELRAGPNTFNYARPINLPDGVSFIGYGKGVTVFNKTTNAVLALTGASATAANADLVCLHTTGATAKMSDGSGNVNCCLWIDAPVRAIGGEISHMTFVGNGTNATGSGTRLGIAGIGASEYSIHDVEVKFVSLAAFVQPVYFASAFYKNKATNCGKGFCFEAGTSLTYFSNYATECQWHGHYWRDISYSDFLSGACDSLNNVADSADYTDRSVNSAAYVLDACRSIDFHGAAEQCFGTQLLLDSCIDVDVNLASIGPASSYTGASQVALVYINSLAQGVRINSVLVERGGVTALQGAAVSGQHHDLYVNVASQNQGFKIGSFKTCNNKYDAPSAIFGNVVPSYIRPLKQGSRIQGEFAPVLNMVSGTGVTITYGANNLGRFSVDEDGFATIDIQLDIALIEYTGTPVYPELRGLPFDNAAAKNARLMVDQSANVTWASTESYFVDVLPATKIGTFRTRNDAALMTCPAAFASGAINVYLHIIGRVYVGDVLNVV